MPPDKRRRRPSRTAREQHSPPDPQPLSPVGLWQAPYAVVRDSAETIGGVLHFSGTVQVLAFNVAGRKGLSGNLPEDRAFLPPLLTLPRDFLVGEDSPLYSSEVL